MADPAQKTSPFVIAASIALILFSVVGVGAMMGWIPNRTAQPEMPAATSTVALPPTSANAPMQAPAAVAEKPAPTAAPERPATKPVQKAPVAKKRQPDAPRQQAQAICKNCGVIIAIRTVEQAGEGSGLGAIAGGVAGAVLGHQVGKGTGKDVATIAGAVGGGYAGHQIEKKVRTTKHYEIIVRMEDGSNRTMLQDAPPAFSIGEKVRIVDGALVRD